MIYKKLLRPLVFRAWPEPEDAHESVMALLQTAQRFPVVLHALRALTTVSSPSLPRQLWGLHFPNPVGLAGGFDKDARAIAAFEALGFGFIEIGTVTARAQPGNERPRVFRLPEHQALINRFGFNNEGAEAIARRLAAQPPRRVPLGVSLGKSKITPLEEAVDDYLFSLRTLYPHGDYFAVNVSSPNTPGLRQLQGAAELDTLLEALVREADLLAKPGSRRKPLVVKVSPDLEAEALEQLLEVCVRRQVDGLIATNTTIGRDTLGLPAPPTADQAGGLSGRPLRQRALEVVRHIRRQLPHMPLIGVGGIMCADDAAAMLDAGADLIQVYTGLIYEGPFIARHLNRGLLGRNA